MNNNEPEILFYNAIISNPYKSSGNNIRIGAVYEPTTTNAIILQKPENYMMSIIRFTIPGTEVPIFNFILKNSALSSTEGIYGVAMEYNGFVESVNLIYVPIKTVTTDYGIYSYERFIDMINTALLTVFNALVISSGGLPASANAAPFLTYDAVSGLLSLYAPTGMDSQAATPVKIWFNTYLWDMVNSFQLKADRFPSTGSNTDNRDYQLMVQGESDNVYLAGTNPLIPWRSTTPSALNWFKMDQERNTLFLWNLIRGFRFRSNAIPTREEMIPAIQSVNTTNNNSTNSTTSTVKIITDMEIQNTGSLNDSLNIISYLPTAQFRFIELCSSKPLQPFDFQIYSVDKFGNENLLGVTINQSITVKFMFVRKDIATSRLKSLLNNIV